MIKLKVLKKIGRSVIDVGIHTIKDVDFARQLVEKGLAEVIEGEIPKKIIRKDKAQMKNKKEIQTPNNKKKG